MRPQLPIIIAIIIGLAACTPPVREDERDHSLVERTEQAYRDGDYRAAAEGYARQANAAAGAERARLQLRAAQAWYLGGEDDMARHQLGQMAGPFTPETAMRRQLLRARLAMVDQPEHSLNLLLSPAASVAQLGAEQGHTLYADFHRLRAEAFARQGHHLESAREYLKREPYLIDEASRAANGLAIWEALSLLSDRVLQQLSLGPPDPFSGWMDLVHLSRAYRQQPEQLAQALAAWRRDYPHHGADAGLIEEVNSRVGSLVKRPANVALLLPLSGRFSSAGNAVLDGVMAAHYRHPERDATTLRVYDTGANPREVLDRYNQAVAEGAEFVIGPLDKEAVGLLAAMPELPVPVLALNHEAAPMSPRMVEFGLAPEEEAVQAAERAWYEGHRMAALVLPQGEWGARVGEAFQSRWEALGGEIVSRIDYDSRENDFGKPLKSLLNLDDSEERRRRVSRLFEGRVEFTPRRRQDVEFFFVAAFPQQARLLRPQLKFHHAGGLPVYATSHVYSGELDRAKDRDMDGIAFGAMPWSLDAQTPNQQLRRADKPVLLRHAGPLQRLVAMGVDAYHLAPLLELLKQYPHERFQGETGSLGIDEQRRVRRELLWASFQSGVPRLQEIPRTPDEAPAEAASGGATE